MPPGWPIPVVAKLKTPASCRKKERFSGKKIEKRVKLICRASTSVSAKSVLRVAVSFMFEVRL